MSKKTYCGVTSIVKVGNSQGFALPAVARDLFPPEYRDAVFKIIFDVETGSIIFTPLPNDEIEPCKTCGHQTYHVKMRKKAQ